MTGVIFNEVLINEEVPVLGFGGVLGWWLYW